MHEGFRTLIKAGEIYAGMAAFTAVFVLLLTVSCSGPSEGERLHRTLEEIQQSGKIRVLTRNAPSIWYIGRDDQATGLEYDMVEAFASSLGLKFEFIVKDSVKAIIDSLERGEADLAAAGLTVTAARKKRFLFGPAYQAVTQQVVCRRDNIQPESISELEGVDIHVIARSSYADRLGTLREKWPGLNWTERNEGTTEDLLEAVWSREIDCTVADSNIVDINRRYYPELIASFNLNKEEQLAWMMANENHSLARAVNRWFAKYRESGRLSHAIETYYGFFEVFDYVDIRRYIKRIDERYPQYDEYFREAAKKHDLPVLLLSAQGYQESHWRKNARSPTGVRGIMMLTRTTARAMGVDNRLDPKQSIFGGAKYMAKMKKSFSDQVSEPDLTWLSLAAYNVGRGHMHDAQKLARRLDLSPYHWKDIKQVLPLLADRKYYRKLKYGYARGSEPVRYVRRIREYQHVLENELAGN